MQYNIKTEVLLVINVQPILLLLAVCFFGRILL